VVQWACSSKGVKSQTQPVKPNPPLPTPLPSAPIFNGDKSVEILNTVAGAQVDLYLDHKQSASVYAGSADANNLETTVIYPKFVTQYWRRCESATVSLHWQLRPFRAGAGHARCWTSSFLRRRSQSQYH
jgi:hypothetical protein